MLLLYTSIFHQCTQGPIVRYEQMQTELRERRMTYSGFLEGAVRFLCGTGKKAIWLTTAERWPPPSSSDGNVGLCPGCCRMAGFSLLHAAAVSDFSAYSDMALGLGRMAGFHYPENFNYPSYGCLCERFLEAVAYQSEFLFQRLCLYPSGRKPLQPAAHYAEPAGSLGVNPDSGTEPAGTLYSGGIYYFAFIVLENYWKRIGFQMRRR